MLTHHPPHNQTGSLLFAHRPLPLHAMVASFGIETRSTPDYDWDGLKRGAAPFVLFQYTLSGRGHLTYAGRVYRPRAGQAMLLHLPHRHRYRFVRDARSPHWRFFWVCLAGREAHRLWVALTARRGPVVDLPPDSAPVRLARELVDAGLARRILTPFDASARAYALTMALAEALLAPATPAARDARLAAALTFAAARFREPIGVGDLAAAAGLSRAHFVRRFTAQIGRPPAVHLRDLRLAEAARLLQGPRPPAVKEVARACGCGDVAHFVKMFKRAFAITPGRFQRSGLYAGRRPARGRAQARSG